MVASTAHGADVLKQWSAARAKAKEQEPQEPQALDAPVVRLASETRVAAASHAERRVDLAADEAGMLSSMKDWQASQESDTLRREVAGTSAVAKRAQAATKAEGVVTARGADVLERWSATRAKAEKQAEKQREAQEVLDEPAQADDEAPAVVHPSFGKLEADMADANVTLREWQASSTMGDAGVAPARAQPAETPRMSVASRARGADVLSAWSATRAKAAEAAQKQQMQQQQMQQVAAEVDRDLNYPAQTRPEASEAVHLSAGKLEADMADANVTLRDWQVSTFSDAIHGMASDGILGMGETPPSEIIFHRSDQLSLR